MADARGGKIGVGQQCFRDIFLDIPGFLKLRTGRFAAGRTRLVNREKWLLIECLSMAEAVAHHYIEKQAMDLRISRREVAENIIKTYQ